MVLFFKKGASTVFALESSRPLSDSEIDKIQWLTDGARMLSSRSVKGKFIGPRREMVTPWSTNAVEICHNMGIDCISRFEQFTLSRDGDAGDKMLNRTYDGLGQRLFTLDVAPSPIIHISDIHRYNEEEGLALSPEEECYLDNLSKKLGRPLTDSEVFGFSQVNSEHCRHKIFNGRFIIDGKEQPLSLFKLIKKTSTENPGDLVSAYKDNVAFVKGPRIDAFHPDRFDGPGMFTVSPLDTVISLKAETHNFPTTVEPFNGAATGTGGEIRDRLGGGKASLPIAGTAVYMTSYPRLDPMRRWELACNPRVWLYQTPAEILIKASNGASDFGNKFGQPLICGSVLTFEHSADGDITAYDKVIMLAGGVGYAAKRDALKGEPSSGQSVILMGGDNYRIGMGGGAVSSVDTGRYAGAIELNAVQRANPEMQKRVANVIRALSEDSANPIISIHDHGAGGHLNALSELVESTGGIIDIDALPIGDPTLSAKEIIGNESQERMGMVVKPKDIPYIERIAERERAPMYTVGQTTGDNRFVFNRHDGQRPIDLAMCDMFGSSPVTVMNDTTSKKSAAQPLTTSASDIDQYTRNVLSLENVACKDWLTNKVDRSVTGKVARQQCQGEIQLPLSDCGVVALDYKGTKGIATSIGHAPAVALLDPAKGSILAIAEALTNIAGANLSKGLKSVSLSANWMWPCNNPGQDAALYDAVKACSDFACELGINIPTGKDSLSMTQKYGDKKVLAPGTVIISAAAPVDKVALTVSPVIKNRRSSRIYYVPMSEKQKMVLGGSALAQTMNLLGDCAPAVDATTFKNVFNAVQTLVKKRKIMAMHDVSAGGLITTLLEMTFANTKGGLEIDLDGLAENADGDIVRLLFSENPALVIQVSEKAADAVEQTIAAAGVRAIAIGCCADERVIEIGISDARYLFDIDDLRDVWYHPSYLLDTLQSGERCARQRYDNYKRQPIRYMLPKGFDGSLASRDITFNHSTQPGRKRPVAAIIREKGINGDREMAFSLYLAGFDVRDVHMTDLMSGRENLHDVGMIVFCGGFSNSDVLGSAKGWASGFMYNETAKKCLKEFYDRSDTLSLGVCNGCQLMIQLGLIKPVSGNAMPRMEHNVSHKFESEFVGVNVPENNSVMFGALSGLKTGIWVAHGEGRFDLGGSPSDYNVVLRYNYKSYPGNPNGSVGAVAGIASADGRHLAMMPHLERAIFPWQCGYYPDSHRRDQVTPWIDAFISARRWLEKKSS